jgi:hypothetical protein
MKCNRLLKIAGEASVLTKNYLMSVAIVMTLAFSLPQLTYAQDVPARIMGTGAFNSADLSFGGVAVGSHLGNCSFEGSATLTPLDGTGLYLG